VPTVLAAAAVAAVVWLVHAGWVRLPESLSVRLRERTASVRATDSAPLAEPGAPGDAAVAMADRRDESTVAKVAMDDAVAAFGAWTNRFLCTSDPKDRLQTVAEGVALAGARRQALRRLIAVDPAAALQASLPWAVRRALPPEIERLLEERLSGVGDFIAVAALPDRADDPAFRAARREVVIDGRSLEAHVYGRLAESGTRRGTAIHGIAIDGRVAVLDSAVRVLDPGEPVPEGRQVEIVSAADAGAEVTMVDLGDRVAGVADSAEVDALAAGMAAADGAAARPAGTDERPQTETYTTGVKEILIIRLRFADQDASFEPQDDAGTLAMVREADAFFVENSFGALSLAATVTPVYTLPQTADWYKANDTSGYARSVLEAGRAVAADPSAHPGNAGLPAYNFRDFDFEVVRYSGGPGAFTGQGYVGSRGCWLKTSSAGVLTHELGHNLGLWHANFWGATDPQTITGPGANVEYADVFDTMGSSNASRWHFNTYEKNRLNWIPAANVETVSVAGVQRIAAHDLGATFDSQRRYALRVRRDGDRDYWLEFRQNPGWAGNPGLMNGLGVRWDPWASSNGGSQLLDTTPFSPEGKGDGAVVIGRTFHDPAAGLFFTPLGKVESAPGSLEVDVRFGSPPGNRPPVVDLTTSASVTRIGAPVALVAAAADADGDALSYEWDFGDWSLGPDAAAVSKAWTAPGDHWVRVTVSDRQGGTASASCLVRVGEPQGSCIRGVVTDLEGNPVPDVRVHNGSPAASSSYREALTDSRGGFVLTGVPAGSWTLGATRPGWVFAQVGGANAARVPDDIDGADFAGWKCGHRISGIVRDASGLPVAGALVSDGTREEPTDENGAFSLCGVEPGKHTLIARKAGYGFVDVDVLVPVGDATGVRIAERTFTLAGEVRGLATADVATVTDGWRATTTFVRNTSSGPVSAFSLPNVPAGRWHLRVVLADETFSASGFESPLEVLGDRTGLVFVREERPQRAISGRVTDRGEGVEGAVVSAGTATVATDSRGRYFLSGVAEGHQTVVAMGPGLVLSPPERAVTVVSSEVSGQDFASTRVNGAPAFTQPATAETPADRPLVRLSARADDDGGASLLRYTWSTVGTPPAGVVFAVNDTNSAANTVAQFSAPGIYRMRVTAADAGGVSGSSDLVLTVSSTPARLTLGALPAGLEVGQSWQFAAGCIDRFGGAMAAPGSVIWRVSGGGVIDGTGWFTATAPGDNLTVSATAGSVSVAGGFSVVQPLAPPRIVSGPLAAPATVGASLSTRLEVTAASEAGAPTLTYTWSVAGVGAGPVVFLPNGTSAARETTARFARAGHYLVRVVVRDEAGQTAEASVEVTVQETLSSWRARFFPAAQLDNPALERSVWGAEADPDGDGIVNLLEYAFELNPLLPAVDGLPKQSFVTVGGVEYLAITFRRNRQASDITFVPEAASDLTTWETGMVLVGDPDAEGVTYRDLLPARPLKQRFVRVRVAMP
jgi:hypothetical protein